MKSNEFVAWQKKFYKSKEWIKLRNFVRNNREMGVCQRCNTLIIKKKWIVDHIIEIDENNKNDMDIILNEKNLQLLCITCHNKKTFGDKKIVKKIDYKKRNGIFDNY